MPNYLGDTEFDNLNTNFYYTSLNEAYYDCKDEKFYNAAEEKLKKNYWKEDVSDKILKALCYVYRKRSEYNYESDICKYLYFWLGNILLDKMRHNTVFFDVIRDLFNILINNKGKICTALTYHIDVDNFKNIKLLFDYSEDYDSYRNQITDFNLPCNEEYRNYLKSYVDIYKRYQGECQYERTSYGYCKVFNEYFAKKDPEQLSKWTCDIQPNEPEEEEEEEEDAWVETEATEEQPSRTHGMEGQNADSRGGFEEGRKQSAQHRSPSDYLPRQDTFLNNSASDNSDGTHPTIISKCVTGAVSVAGALVPSYLLYNYTPAGNLINKLLGRTTRMNHNPLMEAQLMNNFYQPEGFNSQRSGYNISYRPV
ncbi:VIR protein [Plasmodium vivax]|uniref:VIR protein n=1 Tax=Plasmodium vivax TaxID=5855 RepID=A0A1G4ECK9_PLAVI|nr:VIR protein [Plasmodium vivax]